MGLAEGNCGGGEGGRSGGKWICDWGIAGEGKCGSVWPSGKALGWEAGPRFDSASALLSLQKLGSVDTVCDFVPHS